MRKTLILLISVLLVATTVFANTKTALNASNQVGPVVGLDETLDILITIVDVDSIAGNQGSISGAYTSSGFVSHIWQAPFTITVFDSAGSIIHQEDPPTNMGQLWNEIDYDPVTGLIYTINNSGVCWAFDAMDVAGTAASIATPGTDAWAIGYDYESGIIYWADGYSSAGSGAFNLATGVNLPFEMPAGIPNYPWSIAYMAEDPDGYTVWAGWTNGDSTNAENAIYKYNPSTQTWADPIPIEKPAIGSQLSGLSMTDSYRPGYNDLVVFWQGGRAADTNQMMIHEGYLANISSTLEGDIPFEYSLHQNYPNPFNPSTEIRFDLKATQTVNLVVFNMLGKEVANLVNRQMNAGSHSVSFNASDLSSGVYFYRIETEAFTSMKKMVLVK
jgi:Secretion system C-terminal sorting domain